MIKLVTTIDINEAYSALQHPEAGGISLFIGTVRNHASGKSGVTQLDFEGYEPMALKEMEALAETARVKWPIKKLVMIHTLGTKKVGEPVVIIGTSTAHRKDAFDSCKFLIDELKKSVPIWKKEYFDDQTVWVNSHP
ncbi:molybdenum cofactor biosynthesis protein MoaE [Lunatibacter salilacus]|uniref:molybdenum cofactor biosynthesis protein MoaE n=1 Tax=Lunatibacter salilacus TaxID=2483804 RepID=UPI00131CA301|nr:molybdenum cofactor biosynthesis protein MoaE [Lunatibacter salilacus]